jgi:hypothetical protein
MVALLQFWLLVFLTSRQKLAQSFNFSRYIRPWGALDIVRKLLTSIVKVPQL